MWDEKPDNDVDESGASSSSSSSEGGEVQSEVGNKNGKPDAGSYE